MGSTVKVPSSCMFPSVCIFLNTGTEDICCDCPDTCPRGIDKARVGRSVQACKNC